MYIFRPAKQRRKKPKCCFRIVYKEALTYELFFEKIGRLRYVVGI